MNRSRRLTLAAAALGIAGAGLLLALAAPGNDTPAADGGPTLKSLRLADQARPVTDPDLALPALRRSLPPDRAWRPAVHREKMRDQAATAVYTKAAPGVVVVRTLGGFGTGFVVDPAGWIVTNQHVVANARLDPATGIRHATVFVGKVGEDRFMSLVRPGLPAVVYRQNKAKDLALLKLAQMPAGVTSLPALPLATAPPGPGSDCYSIGHPASASLWALRKGEAAAVGTWPEEKSLVLMKEVGLEGKALASFRAALKRAPRVKVLVTNFGAFSGNSGGPLLNGKGEVVAVTFGRHVTDPSMSYHIHLDELRAFLANRPARPEAVLEVPSPWPAALSSAVLDLDGDGVPDTLVFRARSGQPPTAVLLDLAQRGAKKYSKGELGKLHPTRKWEFQFAIHVDSVARVFYATGKDGAIDLILTDVDRDGVADEVLRLKGGKWGWEAPAGRKMIDPSLFTDKVMRQRLVTILPKLR